MTRLRQISYHKVFGLAFAAALLGFSLTNLFTPDKEYSSSEKRNLKSRPDISFGSLTDGSFMEQFDDYQTDQFVGRSMWMGIKTSVGRLMGKNESQGVYYGRGSYLMEKSDEIDEELLDRTCSQIREFAESYPDTSMYFMLVPTSISVNSDLLPSFAITADQNDYIDSFYGKIKDKVETLDVREAFMEKKGDMQLYYHTDHHWTSDAAYTAYLEVADTMGLNVDSYKYGIVTTDFSGSLTSKSGFIVSKTDEIKVYLPDSPVDYVVTYEEEKKKSASCYQTEFLDSDDPYQLFFGGNHSQVTIDTDADSDRKLLVLKDSYANCFMPFLFSSFRQITLIDPRYYYGRLDQLIKQNGYTDVCFIYNANTLAEDNNLYSVLENRQ